MSRTLVSLEIQHAHATITFASEEGLNILSPDVIHSFGAAVAKVRREPSVRTTTLQAEGKVFLAGADIRAMMDFTPDQARDYALLGQGVLNDLEALPSVTVAAINGAAVGGGLEFALACDFRIAVKHAKLGQPEVTLGLIPGWGGISRMAKLVGPARAKRLFLSGHQISAEDAMHFGLVDEVSNSVEDLHHRVAAFCKTFRRAGPAAVALAKRAFRDHDELSAFAECFNNRDCREGMRAFVEKRPAAWVEQ
jgi:enoyl-CoA hydratase